MTNLPRFALSAKAQEWMELAPELVAQFQEVPVVDHEPPETFEGLTWFVVVTNIKCERRAQLGLRRKGYGTYLPLERKHREVSRKLVESERPLLPRYLFVGLREGQDFYHMRGVDGIESIVRNNGAPMVVPTAGLARLRDREEAGEFDHIRRSEEEKARKDALKIKCKPGARVSLLKGSMSGLQAVVQKVQSSGRIEVLIDFLGGVTKAKLRLDEVDLLDAAE